MDDSYVYISFVHVSDNDGQLYRNNDKSIYYSNYDPYKIRVNLDSQKNVESRVYDGILWKDFTHIKLLFW